MPSRQRIQFDWIVCVGGCVWQVAWYDLADKPKPNSSLDSTLYRIGNHVMVKVNGCVAFSLLCVCVFFVVPIELHFKCSRMHKNSNGIACELNEIETY